MRRTWKGMVEDEDVISATGGLDLFCSRAQGICFKATSDWTRSVSCTGDLD